ncbi:hypothetical protein FRB93_005922 [Tulasnella sp. JGI-2019a]|nr:hypothetical protein FRB93_005922 [Tulasnella sp. JGI-2019a]
MCLILRLLLPALPLLARPTHNIYMRRVAMMGEGDHHDFSRGESVKTGSNARPEPTTQVSELGLPNEDATVRSHALPSEPPNSNPVETGEVSSEIYAILHGLEQKHWYEGFGDDDFDIESAFTSTGKGDSQAVDSGGALPSQNQGDQDRTHLDPLKDMSDSSDEATYILRLTLFCAGLRISISKAGFIQREMETHPPHTTMGYYSIKIRKTKAPPVRISEKRKGSAHSLQDRTRKKSSSSLFQNQQSHGHVPEDERPTEEEIIQYMKDNPSKGPNEIANNLTTGSGADERAFSQRRIREIVDFYFKTPTIKEPTKMEIIQYIGNNPTKEP